MVHFSGNKVTILRYIIFSKVYLLRIGNVEAASATLLSAGKLRRAICDAAFCQVEVNRSEVLLLSWLLKLVKYEFRVGRPIYKRFH